MQQIMYGLMRARLLHSQQWCSIHLQADHARHALQARHFEENETIYFNSMVGSRRHTRPASASLDTPFSSSFTGAACSAGRTASRKASSTRASFLTAGSRTTFHSCVYESLIPCPLSSPSNFACRPSASSADTEIPGIRLSLLCTPHSAASLQELEYKPTLISRCPSYSRLADFTYTTAASARELITSHSSMHVDSQNGPTGNQPEGSSGYSTLAAPRGALRARESQAHLEAGS